MARSKKKPEAKPVKKVKKMMLETISEDEVDEAVPASQSLVPAQVPAVKKKRKKSETDDDDVVPPSQVPVVRKGRKQPPSAALSVAPPSSPSADEEVAVEKVKQPPKKKPRAPKPKVEPFPFTIGQIEDIIDL